MPEMPMAAMPMPEIMSQAHARSLGSEVLVCREAGDSPFADDRQGPCADCGRALSYRPYLPDNEPKLCIACFGARKSSRQTN